MTIPTHLTSYPCNDYFDSEFATRGHWDEISQIQVIVPSSEVEELPGRDFLAVGRAGVDGILFGYRAEQKGLWAYYPMEKDFRLLATTVQELAKGWIEGRIKV